MKKYIPIILIVLSKAVSAQQVTISGCIIDTFNNVQLKGASLTFKNSKGQVIKVMAAIDGNFVAAVDRSITTSVAVSFTGYKEKVIPFNFSAALNDYKLGIIYLYKETSLLTEVIIKGRRPPVNFKVDRQVYRASQFAVAANGNAIDLIRNLPSISVNGQGEISLRGSNSFLVLINGKPAQGDAAFVLGQLPAGAIENVELITSPSAAYDADGKSGILNIVTKKGIENGWMVQTNAMYGLPPINDFDNKRYKNAQRFSADVSAAYRYNKWDVSIGANALRNDLAGYREGDAYTILNNVKTSFPSVGERSFKRYNYGGRMAAVYQANKKNTVSAGFYVGKKYQSRVADLLYSNKKENLSSGSQTGFTYFNENTQEKEGLFSLANIEFVHLFSRDAKFSAGILYEKADLIGLTQNLNLVFPGSKDTIQYTRNPNSNPLKAWRFKTDYTKQMGTASLQAGYQLRIDDQHGNFLYLTKINGTDEFITNREFTSHVKLENIIHAAYSQYANTKGKWYYSAGLRFELSTRLLNYSQGRDDDQLDLANLFPSLQVRYSAWDKGNIKIGYNRRIKRTNNYELNPFPEREHSETLEQGDPQLLPEFISNYEVGLEQELRKGNLYVTVYHQQTKNIIQRVNKVYNDTILNRLFTNAGKAKQFGVETNITYHLNEVWQGVVGGNIYHYTIKGELFNGMVAVQNLSWVFSINSTQSFSLPKNWNVQFSINYLSFRATAQGEDGYFLTPHLSLKKTSKDKRWALQAQWLNIDAGMGISNRQRITTHGSNFYTTTNYVYEPDQVQLSVSFNLLKKDRKINLPASEIGEKEF